MTIVDEEVASVISKE